MLARPSDPACGRRGWQPQREGRLDAADGSLRHIFCTLGNVVIGYHVSKNPRNESNGFGPLLEMPPPRDFPRSRDRTCICEKRCGNVRNHDAAAWWNMQRAGRYGSRATNQGTDAKGSHTVNGLRPTVGNSDDSHGDAIDVGRT